jgi:ribosomal protein L37AE/L43A
VSHPIADTTCPHCGNTSGVQPTANTARVTAWSCSDCGTEWAVSVVNPRLYLDRLTATVAARQFVSLADDAPGLTDTELRRRLAGLAKRARRVGRFAGGRSRRSSSCTWWCPARDWRGGGTTYPPISPPGAAAA